MTNARINCQKKRTNKMRMIYVLKCDCSYLNRKTFLETVHINQHQRLFDDKNKNATIDASTRIAGYKSVTNFECGYCHKFRQNSFVGAVIVIVMGAILFSTRWFCATMNFRIWFVNTQNRICFDRIYFRVKEIKQFQINGMHH